MEEQLGAASERGSCMVPSCLSAFPAVDSHLGTLLEIAKPRSPSARGTSLSELYSGYG